MPDRDDQGPLPSGRSRHGLTPSEVAARQRARLIAAILAEVASTGYAALTVADVTAAARVSRRTFYEHFRDKEEAVLAAVDAGTRELLDGMLAATAGEADWVDLVQRSAAAYVDGLVARPDLARALAVEILAVGSRGLAFRAELHRRFAAFYRDGYARARSGDPDLPDLPEPVFRLATGAFDEFLHEWVRAGRVGDLHDLVPLAGFVAAALLTGAPAAADRLGSAAELGSDTFPP